MKGSFVTVITGPTATGKTALGALYAKTVGGEVVSADSMQVYKYMDIGTAKPTLTERLGVPHHMIDIISPLEDYSVAQYVTDASNCINDVISRGKLPVIVGGTGLYIDSLLSGHDFSAIADSATRRRLEEEYDEIGGEDMLRKLSGFDPVSAAKLHANDKKRIVRAFEVYLTSGKPISQHDFESKSIPPRYIANKFALRFSDRAALYTRIDDRVYTMIRAGLENEVRGLIKMGVTRNCTAMQAIGYKEMAGAIFGECSIDDAIERIKTESRRYAKRQLTWLRRDTDVTWITWNDKPDLDMGMKVLINPKDIVQCSSSHEEYDEPR